MKSLEKHVSELERLLQFVMTMLGGGSITYDKKENDIKIYLKRCSTLGIAVLEIVMNYCKEHELSFLIDRSLEITIYK